MTDSSDPESPEEKLTRAIFGSDVESDPKDDQIAALQKQVQSLQERVAEERFLWTIVAIVTLDITFLGKMTNWSAPIVIGLVELVGVVVWADRCGVNSVAPLIDKISGAFKGATGAK